MKWDIYIYKKSYVPIIIDCTQGSSDYVWEFEVKDYEIASGAEARIYLKKPSGKEVYNGCTIEGNTIKIDVTTQMTAEFGKVPAQFQVIPDKENPDNVKSFIFWLDIQKSLEMNSQIESKDEFTILDNLVAQARGEIEKTQKATQDAENATEDANEATSKAIAATKAANEATEEANEAAANANSKAELANTAAGSANEAADRANEAAEKAEGVVLDDISAFTVTFQEALERANIQSGDSLATAFGKLAKFCADLQDYVFNPPIANLTSTDDTRPLAASMGKRINDDLSAINNFSVYTAAAKPVLENALLVDTENNAGPNNYPRMVSSDATSAESIPSDLAWGIREVLYLSSQQILLRITGVKKDGSNTHIWTNVYNYGAWMGWSESNAHLIGYGTPNANYIDTSQETECRYIKIGHICHVSLVFTPSVTFGAEYTLFSDIPEAESYQEFPYVVERTDGLVKVGQFRAVGQTILNWYGDSPKIGTPVKTGITYITK